MILILCELFFLHPRADEFNFFEKKIRPLFHKHCYECHSSVNRKKKGGLYLDSRQGWVKGGDSGPAIVPNNVEASLLIKAVNYNDTDLKMPPKYRLSKEERSVLAEWVRSGAVDPRKKNNIEKVEALNLAEGRKSWAYQPLLSTSVPLINIRNSKDNELSEIDRFLIQRLNEKEIKTVRLAKPEILLRRLFYDLIGLPPKIDQLNDFLNDPSFETYSSFVDRLLASPQFGEKWGRHWLDVSRFAESSGGGRSLMFKNAWQYRDYVIDSFNSDKPFNDFIREQIAGDLLPYDDYKKRNEYLKATGFLALGPHNYELQDKELLRMEVVDEQIDTIGQAFLAMTIGCARCHDHKFDPIPTKDYYAMAGILRSTQSLVPGNVSGWVERSLSPKPVIQDSINRHIKETNQIALNLKKAKKELTNAESQFKRRGFFVDNIESNIIGEWMESTSNKNFFGENYIHDKGEGKGEKKVVFTKELNEAGEYEVWLGYTHGKNRSADVPVTIEHSEGITIVSVNQQLEPSINSNFFVLGRFNFNIGKAVVRVSNEGTKDIVIADAVGFIPLIKKDDNPNHIVNLSKFRHEISLLENRLNYLKKTKPTEPQKVMSVRDQKETSDWHVHIRGEIRNKGPLVPRGFLQVASSEEIESRPNIANGSGRLELAEWIASEQNPLTRRVMVNRIWHYLMGQGIVRTTDNFGLMGEDPSHPELLDWLSSEFSRDNWSVKNIVRLIVLSRAYRLASFGDSLGNKVDPENRLIWRANRKRLSAESIRDSILMASGRLNMRQGGYTIKKFSQYDFGYKYNTIRRSVYVPSFRNTLMEIFEIFDVANPNVVTGRRSETTLPTQALYLLNSPFVNSESKLAGERIKKMEESDVDRIRTAYFLTLGRMPSSSEFELALKFVSENTSNKQNNIWGSLIHSIISSVQFRYLD